MIWRSEQTPKRKSEEKPQSKGETLTLSPSGTLAAITGSLGRILLLDTQALVVVRLWKGYRDASCFFMEMLVNKEAIGSGSSDYEPGKTTYRFGSSLDSPYIPLEVFLLNGDSGQLSVLN
ncbi:Rab3-GAP regulatory subunit, partial [Theobroma cacao]